MRSDLLSGIQFRANRLLRARPMFSVVLGLSLLLSVLALMAYSASRMDLSDAEQAQREMAVTQLSIPEVSTRPSPKVPLRPFNSAEVLQSLNDAASTSELPIGGVTFSFEETPAQPYLRYRATLTVVGNYLSIRRFVEQVHAKLTDVSLDSFSCTRKDIRDTGLACDVSFSAFYRKGPHD